MSVKLSAWVWDGCAAAGIKGNKLLIMARLADYSSDEGISYPGIETIARQIGAGRSTVITLIGELQRDGWLTKTERRQGQRNTSNLYTLNIAQLRRAADAHYSDSPKPEHSKSEHSKSEHSKSEHSGSERSDSGRTKSERTEKPKKPCSDSPKTGPDPSVNSKQDPSDKKISCPDASLPDDEISNDFLSGHPDAVVYSLKKRQWGSQDDLACAEWIWSRIVRLYEQAAETDGEVSVPKAPNWTTWANEIRLMCSQDGRTHRQICELFGRANRDPFWCKNILSPAKLREKWGDLSLKLSASQPVNSMPTDFSGMDYSAGLPGFRTN